LTFSNGQTKKGDLSVDPVTGEYTFTSPDGYSSSVPFRYRASDAKLKSNKPTVTIVAPPDPSNP